LAEILKVYAGRCGERIVNFHSKQMNTKEIVCYETTVGN